MRKSLLGIVVAAAAALITGSASAQFPTINGHTPGFIITVGPSGATVAATGQGPYDNIEDTYIGVINNSGGVLNSLNLSSSLTAFGFDGDGIDTFAGITPNANDNNPVLGGYGGPIGFFTNVSLDQKSGTVNFLGGLANGTNTFFSLEEDLAAANGGGIIINPSVPEPSTWAMMLLGFVGLGFMAYRRKEKLRLA